MASLLRRFSTTSQKNPLGDNSTSRRRSSAASTDGTVRTLGARDYKLAISPEDFESRRSSVASTIIGGTSEDEPLVGTTSQGSSNGRIYGARDYKLIPRRTSS